MGTYEFVEHTADEKFIVTAKDMNDAFATSVLAFYEVVIPGQQVEKKISKEINMSAKRLRSLLYDFLNELVFVYDDEDLILQHVESLTIEETKEGYSLTAKLLGDKHYEYEVEMEIKNMTYSDMAVEQGDGVKLTVVVDI